MSIDPRALGPVLNQRSAGVGSGRSEQPGVGLSLRSWRRRLRLFKAIELMGGGLDVTQTALELGYGSTSALVYAFRTDMGASPQAYMRGQGGDSSIRRRLVR